MKKKKDVDINFKFICYSLNSQSRLSRNVKITTLHFMDERERDFIAYIYLCENVYYRQAQEAM